MFLMIFVLIVNICKNTYFTSTQYSPVSYRSSSEKMVGVVPLHSQDTDRSGSSTSAPSESDRKLKRMSVTRALPGKSSTKVVPSPAPSLVMVKTHVCV